MARNQTHILEHLDDIDFRTRAQRRKQAVPDLLAWRENLMQVLAGETGLKETEFDRRFIEGQLQMLNAVLWTIMPETAHKKLIRRK